MRTCAIYLDLAAYARTRTGLARTTDGLRKEREKLRHSASEREGSLGRSSGLDATRPFVGRSRMPAAAAAAFHGKFCARSRVHVKYLFNNEFENNGIHFDQMEFDLIKLK